MTLIDTPEHFQLLTVKVSRMKVLVIHLLELCYCMLIVSNCKIGFLIVVFQTDADKRFLAAKGSVPIGIGRNSHVKRAIIDKNARIGENVKVRCSSLGDFGIVSKLMVKFRLNNLHN